MSPKKAIIILVIIAIILAGIFVLIYFGKIGQNFSQQKNLNTSGQSQKVLTDEEKRQELLDTLKNMDSQNGGGAKDLTPAQEQEKKQELLNNLNSLNKQTNTANQSLSPAEQEKKKQQLLNLIK